MAARKNGSKVVAIAVAATLTALGVGTVYVPFFMDKDKLRGMHEDADGGLSDRERREYEKYLQHIQQQGGSLPANAQIQPDRSTPPGNSMWKRMNQAASEKK
jgi:flagellar basal body-associated protein FliL